MKINIFFKPKEAMLENWKTCLILKYFSVPGEIWTKFSFKNVTKQKEKPSSTTWIIISTIMVCHPFCIVLLNNELWELMFQNYPPSVVRWPKAKYHLNNVVMNYKLKKDLQWFKCKRGYTGVPKGAAADSIDSMGSDASLDSIIKKSIIIYGSVI